MRFFEVGVTELESVTSCMSSKRSNQLSYTPEGLSADGYRLSARQFPTTI